MRGGSERVCEEAASGYVRRSGDDSEADYIE